MQYTNFIGIDVSKETLDVCLFRDNKVIVEDKIKNNLKSLSVIKKLLKPFKVDFKETLWCLEHTGIFCNPILYALHDDGASIWLENPLQIKLSQGITRGKNDKIDAQRIARYAYTFRDRAVLWKPKSKALINIKQLIRMRNQLMEAKHGISVTIKEAKTFLSKETADLMIKSTANTLKSIIKEIDLIELKINEIVKSDEELNRVYKLVTSVDGIGQLTAVSIIVTTNQFKDFNCPKKYNCYAGLAPFNQQSGKSLKTSSRVSQKANKEVKTLLHMAALTVIRMPDSEYALYYKRKKEEGKNGMTILNAIRAKLVGRVFACVRDNRPYQKNLPEKYCKVSLQELQGNPSTEKSLVSL